MPENDGLSRFNSLESEDCNALLLEYCHLPVRSFAERVVDARPYESESELIEAAADVVSVLTADEISQAHFGLTRLGAKLSGQNAETNWSRDESSGIPRDDDFITEFNLAQDAYEAKFGRTFLISATGLSSDTILTEVRRRSLLDPPGELAAVKAELRKLVAIRLPKILDHLSIQ